jgi:hypothetical protein
MPPKENCVSVNRIRVSLQELTIGVSVEVTDGRGVAVSVDVDDGELV